MSKSLSPTAITSIDNPHLKPIRLVTLTFSGITMRLCDRSFGSAGAKFTWMGYKYEPIIIEWGDINLGEIDVLGKNPPSFSETRFTVDNYIPVFGYDNFLAAISDNDYLTCTVRIFGIFDNSLIDVDELTYFIGKIENPELEAATVIVNCVDVSIDIVNKFAPEVCTIANYPGADPDDIGKIFPIVFGRAKKVPFLAVNAGSLDTLSEACSATDTTLYLSDATGYAPTGGIVQIDEEQIYYSGVSGTALTGCTRGYASTDAVAHNLGAIVAEVQTEYIYAMAHPVTTFNGVYVQNAKTGEHVLQSASLYTAYTGQTGNEHASYPGKAVIVFTTLPVITQQINVEIQDTISVDDSIDVGDPGHDHEGEAAYKTWNFDYCYHYNPGAGGSFHPSYPLQNASDGNLTSECWVKNQGTQILFRRVQYQDLEGIPSQYRLCLQMGSFLDSNCGISVTWLGRTVSSTTANATVRSTWTALSGGQQSWEYIQSIDGLLTRTGTNALGYAGVSEVWIEIIVTGAGGTVSTDLSGDYKIGAAVKVGTVSLVGNSVADTVVGGAVSADVDGWMADSTGYYGTNGMVIERPDYILKKFLVYYCGLSATTDFGSTYTIAGTNFDTYGVRLAVVLLEHENPLDFMTRVAFHSRSIQFFEDGDHQIVYLPDQTIINKTFADSRILVDSLKLGYTPRAEVVNKISANYNRYWVENWDKDIVETSKSGVVVESADSIAAYGTRSSEPVYLDYITGEMQATSMMEWYLGEVEFPTLLVEFDCLNYADDLMRGDIVSIAFNAGSLMAIVTSGLIVPGVTKFRVINISRREDNSATIYCRSCNA